MYLAKQSMFGTSFQKSVSQNDLLDLDSLVQIKNRKQKSSPNCSEGPLRARLQFLATLLGKIRELDSNSLSPVLISLMCFFALHVHWGA